MKKIFSFFIIYLFIANPPLPAQVITRGPYLQMGTPGSMVIRWRTDMDVTGRVNYGTELSNLEYSQDGPLTTEHVISITGLSPATKYYYNVASGSTVLLAESEDIYFKTSPLPGTRQPLRAWVIGDFGNASLGQIEVMNTYLNHTGATHTDVWLWLGDNAYSSGTQLEYQLKVFSIYIAPFRKMVAWPCPGNHDYGSVNISGQGPYFDIFTLPTQGEAGGKPSGTEGYYSFDYGNAHFISLNSENLLWTISSNTDMAAWLKGDLAQNDKDWVIAYWHQPPYTKGSHDSDDFLSRMEMLRQNFNPILEEYGVDLVLCGHSHCYERSYMLKGHYGNSGTFNPAAMIVDSVQPFVKYIDGSSPNTGTVYAVVGCSGQLSASGSLNHPAMQFSTYDYNGSMVIDIDGLTLTAKFLTAHDGIKDSFIIQKISASDTVTGRVAIEKAEVFRVMQTTEKNQFSVQFGAQTIAHATLTLFNIRGEKLAELFRGDVLPGEGMLFPAANYPAGIYFLQLESKSCSGTIKFMLSR